MGTSEKSFPPFSLTRLLRTVFDPKPGTKVAILIDLPNVKDLIGFAFLKNPELTVQRFAHDVFYQGLKQGGLAELQMDRGDLFAYQVTGGSNLDLPDSAMTPEGRIVQFERDIYPTYDLFLCISTFSATAPLTAFAKRFGFRGATLHGLNEIILKTGLAVDYNQVSADAEKLRLSLTRADAFEIDYQIAAKKLTLRLICNRQEAQKSHGLARDNKPDVVNLPAGEVYYVPESAEGQVPLRYEDGSIGLMEVSNGRIQKATLLQGNLETVDAHNRKLASDPVTGEIGELGFGTQELPPSGRDIQDEKILGTLHVATGRSDHLGGKLTPEKFANKRNATHDDILYSPTKTPEIHVSQVRMFRDGKTTVVIENYEPSTYLREALKA